MHSGPANCPECRSLNIRDHSEYGLPLMNDMRCGQCEYMWKKEDVNMTYKVYDYGCRKCGQILSNKMVKEHDIVHCLNCGGLMHRMISMYKNGGLEKEYFLKTLCRIFDKRKS